MKTSALRQWALVGMLLAVVSARAASLPGDAEAAAHGDEAAHVQRVQETEQKSTDFVFRQYNLAVLSHYSYLIGSGGEALIVTRARHPPLFEGGAGTGIEDHARLSHPLARGFRRGHMELAKATGAAIIVNEATKAAFPHKPVKDGDASPSVRRARSS